MAHHKRSHMSTVLRQEQRKGRKCLNCRAELEYWNTGHYCNARCVHEFNIKRESEGKKYV